MSEDFFTCDSCGNRKPMDERASVTLGYLLTLQTCQDCVSKEHDSEEGKRR